MPASKTAAGQVTRQTLIEAAYGLFTSRGYHATSMREIAAKAGITAGSIYNHFADKEQVIKEVLLVYHPIVRVMPVLEQVEGQSVSELIHDVARRMLYEIDASPGSLNLLSIELIELNGRHMPELIERMYPQVQAFLDRVYSTSENIRPQNRLTFFRALIGQLLGYGLTRLAATQSPVEQGPEPSLDEFIDIFLLGVLK